MSINVYKYLYTFIDLYPPLIYYGGNFIYLLEGLYSGIMEKIGIQSYSIIQQHPEDLQKEPDKILFKTLITSS